MSLPRMRVEELASRADVSVETVRFYQKRGLLPPAAREGRLAWYSQEHLDAIRKVKELQRRGFTLAVIRRFLAGELDTTDAALAAALAEPEENDAEEFLTLDQLADRVGVPRTLLDAVGREGLLVPRLHEGEERYTSADVTALSAGLRLLAAGLPLSELLELASRQHAQTREIAESAVALFDRYVRAPLRDADLGTEEKAERLVEAFRMLLPAVTSLVAHHFRRVLLQVAQEHLEAQGEPAEIAAAQAAAMQRLEVV